MFHLFICRLVSEEAFGRKTLRKTGRTAFSGKSNQKTGTTGKIAFSGESNSKAGKTALSGEARVSTYLILLRKQFFQISHFFKFDSPQKAVFPVAPVF